MALTRQEARSGDPARCRDGARHERHRRLEDRRVDDTNRLDAERNTTEVNPRWT